MITSRKELAKLLNVQESELDDLYRVTVQDGNEEMDVNVQAELRRIDAIQP